MDATPQDKPPIAVVSQPGPTSQPIPKIYSAPRRFDLATILVVMFVYALMFAVLKALGAELIILLSCAAFFAVVAIGQAVLFHGKRPRLASVVSGAVGLCLILICAFACALSAETSPEVEGIFPLLAIHAIISGIFFGPPLGYLTGTLVGVVFLMADVLRHRIGRTIDPPDQEIFDNG